MEQIKTDRRIQRTRALLQDALLALIEEKGYAAITVQDILDRANLGRSTFYAHYRDKDELLVSGFEHLKNLFETSDLQALSPAREAFPNNPSLSLAFFRHAGKQQRLYKAMVGKRGGEVVQKYLYQYIFDLMKNHLKQRFPTTADLALPREVITHYFVSSFLALLTWWLDHDMPYTADEMDGMFNTLTMPGLKNALRSR
jgi:AcrR family transcriptional regulator